ncbi:MAG: SUMF1/EgtB/PvdO family nonheme iron enzyme [Bacteroidota bacterium]
MKRNSLLLLLCCFYFGAFGANVTVSNVALTGQDVNANTYQVNFDISWEDSWRTNTFESNWDAVWIVVKYRQTPALEWQQANVAEAGSVFPTGTTADFGGNVGFFLYRDAPGIGDVDFDNVSVRWEYGSVPDDQVLEVCVIATEMVYIPEGAFEVGDGSSNAIGNFQAGNSGNPLTITSEDALTLGGTFTTSLGASNPSPSFPDDFSVSNTVVLPAEFPKGFQAFYIMKYEASEQQYADFLNRLTPVQATNRFPDQFGSIGHGISNTGVPPEIYVTDTPTHACNYLEWADVAAYADWIGLRPVSELEYEKAARGTRDAVADECAWGTPFAANYVYSLNFTGTENEIITNPAPGTGNALYLDTDQNFINQALRCGIFAASAADKTREETGGSYYGVMEMTGNLWEVVITVGDPEGRQMNGSFHGNGIISSGAGESTVLTWPPDSPGSGTYADGTGVKGGSFNSSLQRCAVSFRDLVNLPIDSGFNDVGMRLGRTAP